MVYTFESRFASQIEDFIAQKNALGFGYLESSRLLRDFDRFCLTHFPEENSLTKELCLAWATKKDTEGNNTFRNRMMPVREFARYLNRSGEAAYILPPNISRKDASYAPYIYTEAEILAIWDVFDHLKPRSGFPVRQFVIPAMIKLMYCCGLRPAEARRLRVNDVDLDIGRLNIMESKQHKFHPDKNSHSEAPLFYTVIHGIQQKMSPDTVAAFFKKYGNMAKIVCPEVPEHIHPHMMRHTRAMHLYQSGMPMVLLSQYLGHVQVETTKIYAYADTEMKRAAIQKADAVRRAKPVPEEIWADNEEMILKLSGLL